MRLAHDFLVDLDSGRTVVVTIECRGYYENYGADRDGNRGTRMFFTDDETVVGMDGDPVSLNERDEAHELALKMSCEFDWSKLYGEES